VKTYKPARITIYTSLLISLVSAVVVLVILNRNGVEWFWAYTLLTFALIFLASYRIINYALANYFYHSIRIIYRNILQLKTNPSGTIPRKIPDDRIISEINRIIIDWEKGNKEEIDHLKEMENFRKDFLGNVSHELKTPIFTIQGYIHTLIDGGIEDQEINMLYLQKAARSIDRLISIVDDLESISKLEAGEMILENRTFDLNELIADVMESLELRAKEQNINIFFEPGKAAHNFVYADKERIRQVLVNLLVNSIKYGKLNGVTRVNIEDLGDYVTVDVSDNGIGIEKHHLARLFERFYRVDKSRSREQGGTGLGLAIVKHILEAHHQKISVDSTPGEGTTFTFTLKKSI